MMGSGYRYECDKCGHVVETSGPWEFYRDTDGVRKPFGHPVPISDKAVVMGIAGLSAELYCPVCDKVHDLIVVEFKQPYKGGLFWIEMGEPKEEYLREDAVKCPDCGNIDLVLGPADDDTPRSFFDARMSMSCPRCKKGNLSGGMEWIS